MSIDLLPDIHTYNFEELSFKQLMQRRIHNVLIICSNYDYYLLEEDGRIDEQMFNEYTALNLRYPPSFTHANSAESALSILETTRIDLVITWVDASQQSLDIARKIKQDNPHLPVAALSHYSEEIRKMLKEKHSQDIDFVFHWGGNIDIFLAIIKVVEDRMNAEKDINEIGVKAILLVEDSLRFYSRYLPLIYKILLKQTEVFIHEGLNAHRSMLLKRGRPKILLATDFEEGIVLFEKYKKNLLGIISDVTYYRDGVKDKAAGFYFLDYVRRFNKYFPVLMQSSEIKNKKIAIEKKAEFLYKYSETLGRDIKRYITKYFSFGFFEFWNPVTRTVIAKAQDLKSFQKAISKIDASVLIYHAKRHDFSKWLQSRALFSLAELFAKIEFEYFSSAEHLRVYIVEAIRAYRIYRSRGVIAKFDKDFYDEYSVFSRIGEGALGGKGRGLAFIDLFLKRHRSALAFENILISIPRTVVVSTDVFDEFMETHNLFSFVAENHTDDEILNEFIAKTIPRWAVDEIKTFLVTSNTPIAIRSSSVLEDSLYQPFAGIFATYMVPNSDIDTLLKMVLIAIKSVMASAFYRNSKSYIKATSHAIEESKMAVILQEVIGAQYEEVYYPNISGVARSINVYPLGDEKPEEGIANIALGLGEIIVGGGQSLRFSPYHPKKIIQLSNPDTVLKQTQKQLYALDTDPKSFHVSIDESVNKKRLSLRKIKHHKSLKFVASTYDLQNHVIRPGIMQDGIRVLTFDPILKYDTFPLAKILQKLLKIGQLEMQNPIEIEFAVKLDVPEGKPKVFSFLQIRPIVEQGVYSNILTDDLDVSEMIISSKSALGNGYYRDLYDIVYIKPDCFDKSKTKEIALAVDAINKKMEAAGKKYILIGPGRWGSSDPWLGIPVVWSQISQAKVIVESGLENYRIDPSQGTHFFQNLTSFKVGYLTINPFIDDGHYDVTYLNKQKAVYEDTYLRHIQFSTPLCIIIEGKNNKGVIFKEHHTISNTDDIDTEESPSNGFINE